MSDGNHDGELGAGCEESRTETDEYLSEGENTGVGGRVSEGDQESSTEENDGYTSVGRPLEVTGFVDPPCDERTECRRGKRESVEDISSVGNALPVYDEQVGVEVSVPAEDGQEHDAVEQAGSNDGTVLEVLPGQELDGRKLGFPDVEDGEEAESEDDAGDDIRGVPALGRVGDETERQNKETPRAHDEDDAKDWIAR